LKAEADSQNVMTNQRCKMVSRDVIVVGNSQKEVPPFLVDLEGGPDRSSTVRSVFGQKLYVAMGHLIEFLQNFGMRDRLESQQAYCRVDQFKRQLPCCR
jgi:hypothetical protein